MKRKFSMWMLKVKTSLLREAFIDYTAPKPSADLTITKSESDGYLHHHS